MLPIPFAFGGPLQSRKRVGRAKALVVAAAAIEPALLEVLP